LLLSDHVFEALRISSANEISVHVVNVAFRVHQVLVLLAFNLNYAHYLIVDHVDGLAARLLVISVQALQLATRRSQAELLLLIACKGST